MAQFWHPTRHPGHQDPRRPRAGRHLPGEDPVGSPDGAAEDETAGGTGQDRTPETGDPGPGLRAGCPGAAGAEGRDRRPEGPGRPAGRAARQGAGPPGRPPGPGVHPARNPQGAQPQLRGDRQRHGTLVKLGEAEMATEKPAQMAGGVTPRWPAWRNGSGGAAVDQPDGCGDEERGQRELPAALDPLEWPEPAGRLVDGPLRVAMTGQAL